MPPQPKFMILVRHGKNEAVVRPPFHHVEPANAANKSVSFENKTNRKMLISLPGGVFDENGDGTVDAAAVYTVPAGNVLGNPKEIKLHATATRGIHSFQVFCEETFTFAQGNSDPEFIIE